MAKQTITVDDFDGSPADETIEFALDGTSYTIDLNAEHAAELREALAVYIGHAQPVRGRATSGRRAARSPGSATPAAEVREWAASQGIEVSSRGRIPADVMAAYESAVR